MAKKLKEKLLVPQATAQAIQLSLPSQAPLERLARSLDEFGSNVAGIAVRKQNEAAQEERERGAVAGAEAIAAGLDTEEELLDAGIITRGEGSFFRDGVMGMAGQAHADAFNAALTVAAAKESLHTSVDPDAMDELVERLAGEFNAEGMGEAFAAGFAERAAGLVLQAKQRHAQTVAGNLEKLNNEQATDLIRGGLLEATDGTDPEFLVENSRAVILKIQAQWLGNIRDVHPRDRRLLNLATVRAIESLIDDGILNEDRAIELMKSIPTSDGNSLWGKKLHSDIIQDAVDRSLTRQSKRTAFAEDSALRVQLGAQKDYTERMFDAAQETGILDISEMREAQKASKGQLFTDNFIRDQEIRSLEWEKAAQDTYVGNVAMMRDYVKRIFSGETMSLEEMGSHIKRGELTFEQGLRLRQLQASHLDMLLNNPVETAMYNTLNRRTKDALSAWAGTAFATQAYSAAASTMAEIWQEWRKDSKNAGLTVMTPEFLKFVDDTIKGLQREFMLPAQWRLLQQSQADAERDNKIEPYFDTVFQADPATLKRWYAETLLMREDRVPSTDLMNFFAEPGHAIPADAPVESFTQAILGQLKQLGIDVGTNETSAEIDSILKGLRPRAEEEAEEAPKEKEAAKKPIGKITPSSTPAEIRDIQRAQLSAAVQESNRAAADFIKGVAVVVGGTIAKAASDVGGVVADVAGDLGGASIIAISGFADIMVSPGLVIPIEPDKALTVLQALESRAKLLAGEDEDDEEKLGVVSQSN